MKLRDSLRPLAINFASILSANAFSRIISFVYVIFLSRYLGAQELGVYGTLFAYIGFGNIIADFGINRMLVRDVARAPLSAQSYLDRVVALRLLLSGASFIIWFGVISLAGYSDPKVPLLAPVALLSIMPYSLGLTFDGILRAWEKMRAAAAAIVIFEACKLLALFLVMRAGGGLRAVLWTVLFSFIVYVLWLALVLRRAGLHIRIKAMPAAWRALLPLSLPFAMLSALEMLHGRLDQVLLKGINPDAAQAGFYFNAHRVMDVTLILPAAMSIALVPRFSRNYIESAARIRSEFQKTLVILGAAGCLVASAVYLAGPWALTLAFGAAFAPAGAVLQILTISIFFFFLHYANVTYLIASDLQWKIFAISLIQVLINLTANLLLIPEHGMYGSAWANVISTASGFFMFSCLVWSNLAVSRRKAS